MSYPSMFLKLKKMNYLPLKVAKGKIIKIKCMYCGKIIKYKEIFSHECRARNYLFD